MEKEIVAEIIACLPQDRTLFHYFQDRYALLLLGYAVGAGRSVADLKRSAFARLLQKPLIRSLLAQHGDGWLSRDRVNAVWPPTVQTFLLTLGCWGDGKSGWTQVSRPGCSLVLRLNFNRGHDRAYERLLKPLQAHRFNCLAHPILREGEREYLRETLAWARIDLDLVDGEALIEEIQSDWVRCADWAGKEVRRDPESCARVLHDCEGDSAAVRHYLERVFAPYAAVWDQAMLAAALVFLREELGICRIWYHTWETGALLKRIRYARPPRSLYTQLPRQFCFTETDQPPRFLSRNRAASRLLRKTREPRWRYLEL